MQKQICMHISVTVWPFLHTGKMPLVGHETLKDEWYIVTKG